MNHYRCYRVRTKHTRSERIAETLTWFPTLVEMPKPSSADAAVVTAQQLTDALKIRPRQRLWIRSLTKIEPGGEVKVVILRVEILLYC